MSDDREQLARLLRGLKKGRERAHANRRAERAHKDQQMMNFWRSCKAAGWDENEILHSYAMRYEVQRDTARRRARRLQLIGTHRAMPAES